jgi:hypothetical protein
MQLHQGSDVARVPRLAERKLQPAATLAQEPPDV